MNVCLNFVIFVKVYAVPDNPWHRGSSMVLVASAIGSAAITGFLPCVLYKGGWKQRNQKNYVIKFIWDSKKKYWFARVELFIKLKLACDTECKVLKMNVQHLDALEHKEESGAENDDLAQGANDGNPSQAQAGDIQSILRFNGALPAGPPIQQSSQQAPPPVLHPPVPPPPANNDPFLNQALPPPVLQDVNGNAIAQDPFGVHRWMGTYIKPFKPRVIGDHKVFAAVALQAMDEQGARLGARALGKKMNISESTVNKNLRMTQALINKNVIFGEIPDLNQSLDEYAKNVLGYANYAMISKCSRTKFSNMTREQIRKLLS